MAIQNHGKSSSSLQCLSAGGLFRTARKLYIEPLQWVFSAFRQVVCLGPSMAEKAASMRHVFSAFRQVVCLGRQNLT